eukprot:143365_1
MQCAKILCKSDSLFILINTSYSSKYQSHISNSNLLKKSLIKLEKTSSSQDNFHSSLTTPKKESKQIEIIMFTFISKLLLIVMAVFVAHSDASFIGDCKDTWSRCTTWSYYLFNWEKGTGVWATCKNHCIAGGNQGGTCTLVNGAKCAINGQAYQCQCY